MNKHLVSPFNWNNPLSETSVGESYILMIYRHLDAKAKHFLVVVGVYDLLFHDENSLLYTYTQLFHSIFTYTIADIKNMLCFPLHKNNGSENFTV